MTSFMTQEEMIKAIMKLKKKTKENETSLKDIYPTLLRIQSEMIHSDKRSLAAIDKINEALTTVSTNKDKEKEESWQKEIHECTAELHSYKEQMSQQREILMQLEMKYFTEFSAMKEKFDEQNNILNDQEKEKECKLDELQREISDKFLLLQQEQVKKFTELQREISDKFLLLQQEQVKTFNEINDLKSKMKGHNEILKQHISDNGYKLDEVQRQILSKFFELKEQQKHLNSVNDLRTQTSNFNETLQKKYEIQTKFDDNGRQILNNPPEQEEELKYIKSQTNKQSNNLKQQQIQVHNEILYIKTQIFKLINKMDVLEGMTPLHMACEFGLKDMDNEIIYENTSINAVNKEGMTPLHLACKYGLSDVAIKLINHGAKVNVVNKVGMAPLHFVCKNDFYEVYQPLTLGCYNLQYKNDKSHFHFALKDGKDLSILLELLNHGAEINCKTDEDWTPLHFAAHSGYEIMVKELMKHGADIDCKTNKGGSVIHLAALQGYFISEIKDFTLTDINCKNTYKDSTFYFTAEGEHLSVITELLSQGANAECQNDSEWKPLHVASLVGNMFAVKELLNHGTNVNCKNNNDETPLHIATHYGHVTIVTELLNSGASVNCKNKNYDTPLNLAAQNGLVTILTELLKSGADITSKNKQNKTALELAKEMKRTEAILILLKHEHEKENTIAKRTCSIC